jgi:hypothetical protein
MQLAAILSLMDEATAQELIRLAEVSHASTWARRPSPEIADLFSKFSKSEPKPYISQPLDPDLTPEERLLRTAAGESTEIVVLANDYKGRDKLRDDHINFVVLSAHHAAELAKFWLENQERAPSNG